MELKGERRLPADRPTAWAALNDVEVLKLCVPGCESLTPTGENRYEAVLNVAVGPVRARFKGKLELADIVAPESYALKFEGAGGAAGFARGEARVTLSELSARDTQLRYVANAQVGGKLAQIGSRLVDAAAGTMAEKFFEAFGAQLTAREAPGTSVTPPAPIGIWSFVVGFFKRLFKQG
jgi:uncharacterized protein